MTSSAASQPYQDIRALLRAGKNDEALKGKGLR
jgi:hypothetical protein